MKFWRCKTDLYSDCRELEYADGSSKLPSASFYDENARKSSVTTQKAQAIQLIWEKGTALPILDFVLPSYRFFSCKKSLFKSLDEIILKNCKTFEFMIEDEIYVGFRPTIFIDLFDHETSKYRVTNSGAINNIKHVQLTRRPPPESEFFSLKGQLALNGIIIMSDRLKTSFEEIGLTGLSFQLAYSEQS